MINKLKKKFIALAMASLIVLLSVIVAGMNIINYNSVIAEADQTLEMLANNKGRLPRFFRDGLDEMYDNIDALVNDYDNGGPHWDSNDRDGFAPKGISRDQAEETRFFTILLSNVDAENGTANVITVDTARIYAVTEEEAEDYASKAIAANIEKGFIDDFRYAVVKEGQFTRITFMDCSRLLDSYRKFLYASILMSLLGLVAVFVIICYFAGRIVRPVAESYEKQKRFITDAGHEIKTPLTIIKANLDVIKMDLDDAAETMMTEDSAAEAMMTKDSATETEAAEIISNNQLEKKTVIDLKESLTESLDDISSQVDRLTTLTNDLVYLSRMEEAEGTLTMTEVPISDIVTETAEAFEPVAQDRKKHLSINVTPMLSMQGSTKELEKLISILMENALKYSPEGDTIDLKLYKEGKNIVLEVKNKTLSPLTDEDLAHVFDRFYRTDKSRNSAAGGHGIGLSMASAIVSAHSGKIRARSGDGTEFIVTATMPAN